jgi:hypothetical protein
MVFLIDPFGRVLVCVLQYQRTHLHMVKVCPKVQFKNKYRFFDDGSIKVLKVKIEVDILEKKRECIENTYSPRRSGHYTKQF